jgi:hypothetical protein
MGHRSMVLIDQSDFNGAWRFKDRRNDLACNALVVGAHSHHSNEVHFECKIFHGGGQLPTPQHRSRPLNPRASAPVHLPGHWGTNRRLKGSGGRRIVRAAGDAKDHERVGLTFVPTHQDGTAISAFAFDRRIKRFQHRRRPGHPFNERRRNDLEGPLWKDGHCCHQFQILNSTSNCRQLPI